MNDIQLDFNGLMRQAGMTAEDYLSKAYKILENLDGEWTTGDAIELSKVMAQDYHTSLIGLKMQEIRDAIYSLSTSVDGITEEK